MILRIILFYGIIFIIGGCERFGASSLEIPQTDFTVRGNVTTLKIPVNGNCEWKVSSDAQWCVPKRGMNTIFITLSFNNIEHRRATLTITYKDIIKTITVLQEKYIYNIPVIFHLLYNDSDNSNQYVEKGRIAQIIDGCNKYYRDMNINVQLVPALKDPNGNILNEPGVNRARFATPVMDANTFMSEQNEANVRLIWDVDNYINVVLYTFTVNNTLGISHIPYSLDGSPLDGLNKLNFIPRHSNLKYPHCISLNNSHIYNVWGDNIYRSSAAETTLAHELGHYLGLFHVFSDQKNDSDVSDSDYCNDTPCYIRKEYENWAVYFYFEQSSIAFGQDLPAHVWEKLLSRTDYNGNIFVSDNIMDYEFGYLNKFTKNQNDRIIHVLNNSPLIPGAKIGRTKADTRSGLQELPMRYID